jgi:hypothetical protein
MQFSKNDYLVLRNHENDRSTCLARSSVSTRPRPKSDINGVSDRVGRDPQGPDNFYCF